MGAQQSTFEVLGVSPGAGAGDALWTGKV